MAHNCGPNADPEFFAGFLELMEKFPHLRRKYQVACVDHETDVLKINFAETAACSKIDGGKIITEFRPIGSINANLLDCCQWGDDGMGHTKCVKWWV